MELQSRIATPADMPFLQRMLYEAAYWRPGIERPSLDTAFTDPELSKLLQDWGQPGDAAIVATDGADVPLGAAWYRYWREADHSYGFVDESTPEVAIGVEAAHRGEGVGGFLLDVLLAHARSENVSQLSLSVEKDNSALRLYERKGFAIVGEVENAWTMMLRLPPI